MKEYPDLNTNDNPEYHQRKMIEQLVTPGLTNPNNCGTCDYMKMGDGDGHCYMFKDSPTEECLQHTGRDYFNPMRMLDIVPDDTDVMNALFLQAAEDLEEHDLDLDYDMREAVAEALRKWKKAMSKRKKQARARTGRR